MYNGERTDAIPTPTPPIILAIIKKINESGIVHPSAEIKNNDAAIIRIGFLPNLSLRPPDTIAPIIAPTRAELANHPVSISSNEKYFSIKLNVPEITAVSNPKSNPPKEPTKQIIAMKKLLGLSGLL